MPAAPMSQDTLTQQYKGAANLEARVGLHERFSTNSYGWHRWVFDQIVLPDDAQILEVGCGIGRLWYENRERIPPTWRVTLSDFSPGMLAKTQQNTVGIAAIAAYEVADVARLSYAEATFDAVIANHMLYYLNESEDRARVFADLARLLKPGGTLYAATNGLAHMRELVDLVHEYDATIPFVSAIVEHFCLEHAPDELRAVFPHVDVTHYADGMIVTEVETLVEYVLSMSTVFDRAAAEKASLEAHIRTHFAALGGTMLIGKDSGLIRARR